MATALKITSTYMTLGSDKFDTRNRYLREVASSPTLVVPLAATIVCNANVISGNQYSFWRWRVGSATFVCCETNTWGVTPPTVSSTKTDVKL